MTFKIEIIKEEYEGDRTAVLVNGEEVFNDFDWKLGPEKFIAILCKYVPPGTLELDSFEGRVNGMGKLVKHDTHS